MSYYVKRYRQDEARRIGWVGPIRSLKQANKEVAAWIDAGYPAELCESTPEVRAEVRAWLKEARR